GEDGSAHEAETAVLVQDLRPDDVAGHQVGGELDAVEAHAQGLGHGVHQQGLGQAGYTHQQAVAAAEDGQQHVVHHLVLPDDDLADLPAQGTVLLTEAFYGLYV